MSVCEAFQHIDPNSNVFVFEGGLKDSWHTSVAHELSCTFDRLIMLPGCFANLYATTKQQMGMLPYFSPYVCGGARGGCFVGQWPMNE